MGLRSEYNFNKVRTTLNLQDGFKTFGFSDFLRGEFRGVGLAQCLGFSDSPTLIEGVEFGSAEKFGGGGEGGNCVCFSYSHLSL